MFKTLKISVGLVISVSMAILATSIAIVNKLEHSESVMTVVADNTAALSNSLALQLSILMQKIQVIMRYFLLYSNRLKNTHIFLVQPFTIMIIGLSRQYNPSNH